MDHPVFPLSVSANSRSLMCALQQLILSLLDISLHQKWHSIQFNSLLPSQRMTYLRFNVNPNDTLYAPGLVTDCGHRILPLIINRGEKRYLIHSAHPIPYHLSYIYNLWPGLDILICSATIWTMHCSDRVSSCSFCRIIWLQSSEDTRHYPYLGKLQIPAAIIVWSSSITKMLFHLTMPTPLSKLCSQ